MLRAYNQFSPEAQTCRIDIFINMINHTLYKMYVFFDKCLKFVDILETTFLQNLYSLFGAKPL